MGQQTPRQTREGRLIEDATKASGRSIRSLAANAGMSDTRWRQIMKGSQPGPGGEHIQVVAPALTLAKMAAVLQLDPAELVKTGRTDAADLLVHDRGIDLITRTAEGDTVTFVQVKGQVNRDVHMNDEIDLIYRSTTMSPLQKLEMIRMVLELRAQVEEDRKRQEAPTPGDVGASVERKS
jgi:hypothetical protein